MKFVIVTEPDLVDVVLPSGSVTVTTPLITAAAPFSMKVRVGLTQWAWAKAGVSMPHYTVSQFQGFPRVPLDQLQPGDLVFFNVSLGHVGMYIGNGSYVQAPHTGDVVKISSLAGRTVVGVVRPG